MKNLRKKNFKFAGESLAEIWSEVIIDKHPTKAEYIDPDNSEIDLSQLLSKDDIWNSKHVQTSQYMTQVVKCDDRSCCKARRSSIFKILYNSSGFIPAPIPIIQTDEGVIASKNASPENEHFASLILLNSLNMKEILPADFKKYKSIPYDLYCPSVKICLDRRICSICGKYFSAIKQLSQHVKNVQEAAAPISTPKVRPSRVAARRANEIMAIISNFENCEDVEWVDEDDLEAPPGMLEMIRELNEKTAFPITTLQKTTKSAGRHL